MEKVKAFMRGFCSYKGKRFYIDLTDWVNGTGGAVIDVVEKDGSRRDATKEDADLMDLLMYGKKEKGALGIVK